MPTEPESLPSGAPVSVLEPDNVVFAKIVATLDLDQHQFVGAGVGQSVFFLRRDVVVFTGHGGVLHIANLHDAAAVHQHPVFGPLVVVLQAQALAGFDGDALDLVATILFQCGIGAPGAMHRGRQQGALVVRAVDVAFLERVHHAFDVLCLALGGDQQGIGCVHHHQVLHAHRGHDLVAVAIDVHMGSGGVDGDPVGAVGGTQGVAAGIGRVGLCHGGPGPHIAPAEAGRHEGHVVGALHHGVVDADVGLEAEAVRLKAGDLGRAGVVGQRHGLGGGLGQGLVGGAQHVGRMFGQRRQHGASGEAEHATVPVEAPGGQVLLRRGQIGFFDELEHGLNVPPELGHLDIAEAGFRAGGLDAEHHQLASLGLADGFEGIGHESFGVGNQVVGGQHQHDSVVAVGGLAVQRRQCNGGGGVATLGFEQVARPRRVGHVRQQTLGKEQMVLIGDDEQIVDAAGLAAGDGLLKQGTAAELHEGLGVGLA